MSCEWKNKVDFCVDRELPDAELMKMEAHMRTCPQCAADALGRVQMKNAVRNAAGTAFVPSPEFQLKVERAIGARQAKWRWLRLPQYTFATAAVFLIALIIGFWGWGNYRNPTSDTLGEVADLHVAALASANPVDVISTDRHTVKPWFEGKLPFTFNLPELQNSQFRLIGGKLTYLEQHPGAQLIFGIRKHQISVFIFQNQGGLTRLGSSLSGRRKLQFPIETWAEEGLRYFVIGDAGDNDIHALSDLLKSAARY